FALVLFGALFTPHLYWNAQNGFETVGHTLDNANLGGELFNLENFPTFLADQMGVFGPVSFLILMAGLTFVRGHKDKAMEGDANPFAVRVRWLACFIVPVLVFIGFQAVLSRAHANWAATAYPAASVLVGAVILRLNTGIRTWLTIAGVLALAIQLVPQVSRPALVGVAVCVAGGLLILGALFRWRAIGLFWGGAGLHLAVAAVFAAISIGPASWSAALGLDNALKRTRGWQALADQLVLEAEQRRPSAIILDEREIWHGLDYYTRGRLEAPLILWRYNEGPKNFAEKQALTPALGAAALVASNRSRLRPRIKADFGMWMRVGDIGVDLGNRSNGCPLNRSLILYSVGNYEPQARTPDWVERFKTTDANGRRVDTHLDRPPPCPPLPDKIAE
ncbi:MAG: glycosyltransferase family 39 protein, partial [Pseudomonadota bacterium]